MSRRSDRCTVPDERRCEALLRDMYMRATNDRCGCHSSVAIDGRKLCGRHASVHAMHVLLREGKAQLLPWQRITESHEVRFVNKDETSANPFPHMKMS